MDQSLFTYDIIAEDPKTHARAGVLHTPHGDIETPIFMPVGTRATVKGVPWETVKDLGAQIVLSNTYHLAMRPGADLIDEMGGLHSFMNWHGPILTDSGGFQIFSHSDAVKLSDKGVRFIATDYDGSHVFWSPEDNMAIAQKLGSDICMQLDQCIGYPAERRDVERAMELGVDAVQVATRFVTTEECDAPLAYKEAYINAKKEDIVITKSPVGMPGRAIMNPFLENVGKTPFKLEWCYQCLEHCDRKTIPYCITKALIDAAEGDVENSLLFCGSNAYRAEKIETVPDVMRELCGE